MSFRVPEAKRVNAPHLPPEVSRDAIGTNNGAFLLHGPVPGRRLRCIASDGGGWEHVSVSVQQGRRVRVPTWEEMCRIKDAFWGPEDVVMQLHPRRSEYVDCETHTLHLWRPSGGAREIPTPPSMMVGPKPEAT